MSFRPESGVLDVIASAAATRCTVWLAVVICATLMAGAVPVHAAAPAAAEPAQVRVEREAPYAPHPRGVLDVYYSPVTPGTAGRPLVVFFHGGSWRSGSKEDVAVVARMLAAAGLVVVTPNYRLFPQVRFEGFMRDAARAVATARAQAGRWGADPDRLVLGGYSAGGHIAAMLAYDPRWLAHEDVAASSVAAFVGVAGTYDFLPDEAEEYGVVFGPPEAYREVQPIAHVRHGSPPALILHGARDRVVPLREPQALADALLRAGVQHELRIYPTLNHRTLLKALADPRAPSRIDGGLVGVRAGLIDYVLAVRSRSP